MSPTLVVKEGRIEIEYKQGERQVLRQKRESLLGINGFIQLDRDPRSSDGAMGINYHEASATGLMRAFGMSAELAIKLRDAALNKRKLIIKFTTTRTGSQPNIIETYKFGS